MSAQQPPVDVAAVRAQFEAGTIRMVSGTQHCVMDRADADALLAALDQQQREIAELQKALYSAELLAVHDTERAEADLAAAKAAQAQANKEYAELLSHSVEQEDRARQAEQERDEARAGWNAATDRAMLAEAPERDR
jgi:hypothetical protein